MSAAKKEDTNAAKKPAAAPAVPPPQPAATKRVDGRKLVQLVDALNRVLVAHGDRLEWQTPTKAGAVGMWVVEGAGQGRVTVRNFRDPHMCLDAGGTAVRAVNTLVQPEPLPLQIVRMASARGPARMAFAPGHSQTPLPMYGLDANGFTMQVLASQSLPEAAAAQDSGDSAGVWLLVFLLIAIMVAAIAWAAGWIELPGAPSLGPAPAQPAEASQQAVLDMWNLACPEVSL